MTEGAMKSVIPGSTLRYVLAQLVTTVAWVLRTLGSACWGRFDLMLRGGYDGYGRIRPGPRQGSKGSRSEDTMGKDPRI